MKERGTRAGIHGKTRLRFVTHLSVDRAQIDKAIALFRAGSRYKPIALAINRFSRPSSAKP